MALVIFTYGGILLYDMRIVHWALIGNSRIVRPASLSRKFGAMSPGLDFCVSFRIPFIMPIEMQPTAMHTTRASRATTQQLSYNETYPSLQTSLSKQAVSGSNCWSTPSRGSLLVLILMQ